MLRAVVCVLLALSLLACTTTPRGLTTREDYEDWQELRQDRDYDPAAGAPGPPRPGRDTGLGTPDWRYGEFTPPSIDPDAIVDDFGIATQVGNTPWGRSVIDKKGDDIDLLIYGSSEDIAPDDAGYPASGAAVIRIPF